MGIGVETAICPDCGMQLQGESWSTGLCPRCLLGLAMSESQEVSSEAPTLAEEPISPEAPTVQFSEEVFSAGDVRGDRYQIRSRLGRGGMGEVWRAYDLKLRVDLALKALLPELVEDEQALAALRQEVRSAREVISPNVCRVFDLEEMDGRELVSMEYIDGTTLLDILRNRGPLDLGEAREIAAQFLAGLEAIHEAGLVHRDMKPENIMITRSGRVVVMDFGIAKGLAEGGRGSIAGTPAYMAPEHARGAAVDARADVFAAGVVLAEMIAPGGVADLPARRTVWEGVRADPPELPDSPWLPVLRKALAEEADERYGGASSLVRALEEVALRVEGAEEVHPYPGLAAFTVDDAEYFFGRELEVEEMWKKLRRPHLTALIGPSGAGKSSFLRAGLLPVMPEDWRAVVSAPGNRPFMALASALATELEGDADAVQQLLQFDNPDIAVSVISSWRRQHKQALIVVDQFEELFTQNPEDVQSRFSEFLSRLVLEADTHVLLSMRDDFLFYCSGQTALAPIFSEMSPLRPPSGGALRRAVVQPALKCGYRFEDEALVEEILTEVEDERGALPMLAFAASRLWEQRDRKEGLLTREAYEQIGGVGGALAQHAEATLERIGGDRIPLVREIFRNLVTAQGTRAARGREELLSVFGAHTGVGAPLAGAREGASPSPTPEREAADAVLNTLIDARLITSYEVPAAEDEDTGHHRIEIVHESLLSNWPRLVRWQSQDADSALLRDQLRQAAQLWEEKGRSEDLLWSGAAFREYELWRERYSGGLTSSEEAFSWAMKIKSQRRRRIVRITTAAAILVLLAVVGVVTGLWRQSEVAKAQAEAEARRAEAANLVSLGRLELDSHPTSTLAYVIQSLTLDDLPAARKLALEALWRGPTEFRFPGGAHGIDFSPDGEWLAAGGPDGSVLWRSDGGGPVELQDSDTTMEIQIGPESDFVVSSMDSGRRKLGIWSYPDGRLQQTLEFEDDSATMFRLAGDGRRLITATDVLDGEGVLLTIRSRPLAGGEATDIWQARRSVDSAIGFAGEDPTGRWLGWMADDSFHLRERQADRTDETFVLEHDEILKAASFDQQGEILATSEWLGKTVLWKLAGRRPKIWRTLQGEAPMRTSFDSTGRLFAAATGTSEVWDLEGPPGLTPVRLYNPGTDYGLSFHLTGRWIATTQATGTSAIWPLTGNDSQILTWDTGGGVHDLEFSPDGSWLASATADGRVRLWPLSHDVAPRERVLHYSPGAYAFPTRLAFDPAGRWVAASYLSAVVRILSFEGDLLHELTEFQDVLWSVAVSPDGRFVAAGGGQYIPKDAVARVWDLETGDVSVLDAGDGEVIVDLAFLSSGELLSASPSGVRRWNLEDQTNTTLWKVPYGETGPSPYLYFDLSPDESSLIMTHGRVEGGPWIMDLESGEIRSLAQFGEGVVHGAFDATGSVASVTRLDGSVEVGALEGGEPHLLLGNDEIARATAISPDGRWVVSGGRHTGIRFWTMPDLSRPPIHTLEREELLAKLEAMTNLRVVEDSNSGTGWRIEIGPLPSWEEVPTW